MQLTQPSTQPMPIQKGIRNSKPVVAINRFFASPFGLFFFAALTMVSFIFSLELYLYAAIIVYVLYVCLFGEDFMTILPLFLFCYVSPSSKNNPGKAEASIFYGLGGKIILGFAAIAVVAIFLRIATDKKMGFKRLFTQKRSLLWSFLILGLSYLMSGIGSDHYPEIATKNLLFSALQFLSLFLLYFLFSATVDWKTKDKSYLAWAILAVGLLVSGELLYTYLTNGVIQGGMIERANIYTGWGMYNNIGAMIAISIPFALYLATRYRLGFIFVITAMVLLAATFFSCSRGSCIGASIGFTFGLIFAAIKAPDKLAFILTTFMLFMAIAVVGVVLKDKLLLLFDKVPDIMIQVPQNCQQSFWDFLSQFNDSNRFEIYKEGLNVYIHNPIFGDSFYPSDYAPWDFSELEQFSGFFPPRWHNTIIQLMASCGTFGLLAYVYHRIKTIRLFCKRPSTTKTFIALGIFVLLLMSMLDCHLFNIGPAFFYSICLTFAENVQEDAQLPLRKAKTSL